MISIRELRRPPPQFHTFRPHRATLRHFACRVRITEQATVPALNPTALFPEASALSPGKVAYVRGEV